jgi:putative ATP-binding cassette transporter
MRCSKSIRYARTLIVFVMIAGVVGGASTTVFLAVINSAINRRDGVTTSSLVLAFIGIALLGTTSRVISQVLLMRLTTNAVFNLRLQLCRRILTVPLRKLEESGAHRLLAALTDDIPNIINALISVPLLCTQIAILVCAAIYLAWLSWMVFIVVLVFMATGVVLYRLTIKRGIHYLKLLRAEWDMMLKHFRGMTDGAKELKLHRARREDFFAQGIESASSSLRRYRIAASTIFISANCTTQIISSLILGILIFVIPMLKPLDAHVLTGYTLVFFFMLGPLQDVLNGLPNLAQAGIAVGRVEELGLSLEQSPVEVDADAQPSQDSSWAQLELAGVVHEYHNERDDNKFALGPLDLTFYPQELVFITGGNGSGKTTLVKLLTGLYAPESGEIRLNSQPVTDLNRDYYRQHFSVVFSDYYLFESFFGLSAPELDTRAHDYLTRFQLDHKVQVTDGVLSTTGLSQGQRKRLALLTAYLEDRSIYVFDEWAADQDPQFKEVFYYQILPDLRARGKTVIVISHDDRYYHVADRVIKLDEGKVVSDTRTGASQHATVELPVPVAS